MTATKFPYGCNHHGFYCQYDKPTEVFKVTKKDLIKMADLRHPVLTKNEYYNTLSTDMEGKPLKRFTLMCSSYLLIIER